MNTQLLENALNYYRCDRALSARDDNNDHMIYDITAAKKQETYVKILFLIY